MNEPEWLRDLHLPDQAGHAHLSAASALVRVGERLFVVADDELHLGLFNLDDPGPGRVLRLFEGELPAEKNARKAAKPDLEALVRLPALPGHAEGALLALGSGSTDNRHHGVLLGLEEGAQPRILDLAPLYRPLRQHFADLNIEGGFLLGDEFILLQRGNQGLAANAAVRYAWPALCGWLLGQHPAPSPSQIQPMALGELDGVALGFTDVRRWTTGAGCSARWRRTRRTATTTVPVWAR